MSRLFGSSLRAQVALGVALPLVVGLSAFSYAHFLHERRLVEGQLRDTASQLGEVMAGALRHAMLRNDRAMLTSALGDIADMQAIDRVQLVDERGVVRFDSAVAGVGGSPRTSEPGCSECHALAPVDRPRATLLAAEPGLLRIATPIHNEPGCAECHGSGPAHLGVLLADAPVEALEADLLADLTLNLVGAVVLAVGIGVGVYLLAHVLVVRRLEAMQAPLAALAAGDLQARLPQAGPRGDEIGRLATAFNDMARQLEAGIRRERQSRRLREKAAAEERERIARELHDGLAQILGYVSTKAMAVRLLLSRRQRAEALGHLEQLEQAASGAMTDVREAILGLRMTAHPEIGLSARLQAYAEQFSHLSGVPVSIEIPDPPIDSGLSPEADVELLRIVQEAFTNIRKHAHADQARLRLTHDGDWLVVSISDDGRGFDPSNGPEGAGHFGLDSMHQRALRIGAELRVRSQIGQGTEVTVRLEGGNGHR